jgi:rubrerythrin
VDYSIAEHLEPPEPKETLDEKDAYLLAAHRELRAYNFYRALAAIHPEGTTRQMLDRMANEELKHKEKVEYLYSNAAFPQTDGG